MVKHRLNNIFSPVRGFVVVFLFTILSISLGCMENENAVGKIPTKKGKLYIVEISENSGNTYKWKAMANAAILNESTGIMDFFSPRIEFYENGRPVSRVTAKNAKIDLNTRDTVMNGNVVVNSKKEGALLKTEKLSYLSESNKIHTTERVTIYRKDAVIKGDELTANPDLSNVEIKNQETQIIKR